jgi:hypothetical protein
MKDFDNQHVVSFVIAAGDWQDVKVALPMRAGEKLIHLRIYLPAQTKPVEVQRIQLLGAKTPAREWTFGASRP